MGPGSIKFILNEIARNSNTNHQAIIDFKGNPYFIYHNGSINTGGLPLIQKDPSVDPFFTRRKYQTCLQNDNRRHLLINKKPERDSSGFYYYFYVCRLTNLLLKRKSLRFTCRTEAVDYPALKELLPVIFLFSDHRGLVYPLSRSSVFRLLCL